MSAPARHAPAPAPRPRDIRRTRSGGQPWLPVPLGLGVVVLMAAHLATGTQAIAVVDVGRALLGTSDVDPQLRLIIVDIRLPRMLVAALAGAMLALAGALLQTVLRNPLAAPSVLGVSSGAVLLAAITVTYGPPVGTLGWRLPMLALVGGITAGLLVYGLGRTDGHTDPTRLILAGVLLGGIASSATAVVVIVGGSSVSGVMRWMIGSLNGRVWTDWAVLWPWALATVPLALLSARQANLLQLGDEVAAVRGLHVERTRIRLIVLAAALTAGAVAIVGAVAFIGLIVPHTIRGIVGSDTRRVFPLSALAGSGLLIAADAVVSTLRLELPGDPLSPPALLPVGVLTALLGGAFFALMLWRGAHRGAGWIR